MLNHEFKVVSNNIRFPSNLRSLDLKNNGVAIPGSMGVFEVLSSDGGYIDQLDLEGEFQHLCKGDYMVGVFGIRQSGTNISGDISKEGVICKNGDIFQILSSSAIVGNVRRVPEHIGHQPVNIRLEGLVSENDKVCNLTDLTPYKPSLTYEGKIPIILGLGSSAECGKTTLIGKVIKGFKGKGMKVAASKTNGSGNIRDTYSHRDAGADSFLDKVDFGLVTTYNLEPSEYLPTLYGILNETEKQNPDVIILEPGGDVMWASIPALLSDNNIKKNVVAVAMCSTDYMGAYGAFHFTKECGITAPFFFNVPILKEAYYRKSTFQKLVNAKVYNVMNPEESNELIEELHREVIGFNNG